MLRLWACVIVTLLANLSFSYAENIPQRIVSLSPSITEGIYVLKAQDRLVGVTKYCNFPPEAQTKQIIGNVVNPNVERIFSMSPDAGTKVFSSALSDLASLPAVFCSSAFAKSSFFCW